VKNCIYPQDWGAREQIVLDDLIGRE